MAGPRDQWSSRAGFILAAAGSAVGLGNLWKFPFITWDNNGGAFVLVYLVCICICGLPIMMAEILVGRRTQKSAVGALKEAAGPAWGFVGALGVLTGFVILGYYTVIAGWSLRNFVSCVGWSLNGFPAEAAAVGDGFGAFLTSAPHQLLVTLLFMAATMAVVYFGIGRGIERTARLLMPVLFVILVVLLLTALTMDGAGTALARIFVPRVADLDMKGVLEALGHSFFTLSLGMGAMITYGSYMKRSESIVRASLLVVVLDTLIALVATVIMFSVIYSVAGMEQTVNKSPVTMLFVTLPQLFYTKMAFGNLLAPLFYVLVSFAALTSTISLLEVVVAYFIDQRGLGRPAAVGLCGTATLVIAVLCSLSLGASGLVSGFELFDGKAGLLSTLDHLASNWFLPVGGFFITLAVGWAMTRENSENELVDENTPAWFNYGVWRFVIRYVAPLAVAAIIVAVLGGKDFS